MAQIALSLMLLFSAGLFFRGALEAGGLNPGFDPRGDLVSEIDFSLVKKDPTEARRLLFATIQHLRELPGVRVAALAPCCPTETSPPRAASCPPVNRCQPNPKAPDPGAGGLFTAITPGYFDAIGVRILRGAISRKLKLRTRTRHAS